MLARVDSYDPVSVSVSVSVGHSLVFYRNGWTAVADFWVVGSFRLILHYVLGKFRYLQK